MRRGWTTSSILRPRARAPRPLPWLRIPVAVVLGLLASWLLVISFAAAAMMLPWHTLVSLAGALFLIYEGYEQLRRWRPRPPANVRAIFPGGRVQPLQVVYDGYQDGAHVWMVTELLPIVEGLEVTGDRLGFQHEIRWALYYGRRPTSPSP